MKSKVIITLLCLMVLVGCQSSQPSVSSVNPTLEVIGEDETSRAIASTHQSHKAAYATLRELAKGNREKDYTIMVYMVGSNLESQSGKATSDLQEIVNSGIDFTKHNVIAYTGGARRWNSNVANDYNSVLDMSRAEDQRLVAQTSQSSDMGAAETLREFVNYTVSHYPAKHYGLILWNHGGGPLWGYGSDELFGNDSLTLKEMQDAMNETPFTTHKLGFVGFDACLMGSVEIAQTWAPYASYFVASEELESGDGWDYSFLSKLNETDDAREITSHIVTTFGDYYKKKQTKTFHPDATLAAIDLAKIDAVTAAMETLGAALKKGIKKTYTDIRKRRSEAKTFGLAATKSKTDGYDLIDLADLANRLDDQYATKALITAIEDAVVTHATNVDNTCGLSVYFPSDNRLLYKESEANQLLGSTGHYREFVTSYMAQLSQTSQVDYDLGTLSSSGQYWSVKLSKEQLAHASSISYIILNRFEGSGEYSLVSSDMTLKPDENGVVKIPKNPDVVALKTRENQYLWHVKQLEDHDGVITYATTNTRLCSGYTGEYPYTSIDDIKLTLRKSQDQLDIIHAVIDSDAAMISGRNTIDITDYYSINDNYGFLYRPVKSKGRLLPYQEWQNEDIFGWSQVNLDDSFSFETTPLSTFSGDFYCQLVIEDINGKSYGSNLAALSGKKAQKRVAVKTKQGKMTFVIENDEAIWTKYQGKDEQLEIPAEVDGHPVTAIGSRVFDEGTGRVFSYFNKTVTSLTLPATIKTIQEEAFKSSGLKKVVLNQGLQTIGDYAFTGCLDLETLTLPDSVQTLGKMVFAYTGLTKLDIPSSVVNFDETSFSCMSHVETYVSHNDHIKCIDGVLYSEDGTTLLACPGTGKETCRLEKTTTRIAYGAFMNTHVKEVQMNEGLKEIANHAFYSCNDLTSLKLPDSLEKVGSYAFGYTTSYGFLVDDPAVVSEFHIGKALSKVGDEAFTGLHYQKLIVDAKNESFSSRGNCLTNKAGDTLMTVPVAPDHIVEIPSGITTIASGEIFAHDDKQTHYILPDSLFRITKDAFPYANVQDGERVYNITIHASPDSAAIAYAKRYNIAYDHEMRRDYLSSQEETMTVGATTYTLDVYKDHVKVIAIDTQSDTLDIPAAYKKLPITQIDLTAQKQSLNLKSLMLPASLESFAANSYVKTKSYTVASDNTHLISQDGILFTHDMKKLIAFPAGQDALYEVPEGVEEIGADAFAGSSLTAIKLPDTLKVIHESAFSSSALKTITWNEGLETIGKYAFHSTKITSLSLPDTVKDIGDYAFSFIDGLTINHLPVSLRTLGTSAFYGQKNVRIKDRTMTLGVNYTPNDSLSYYAFLNVAFDRFVVAKDNKTCKGEDAFLLSKNGKTLYVVAPIKGKCVVPESVETMAYGAFALAENVTDVYLPDSLLSLDENIRANSSITFHGKEDSLVHQIAMERHLKWVNEP